LCLVTHETRLNTITDLRLSFPISVCSIFAQWVLLKCIIFYIFVKWKRSRSVHSWRKYMYSLCFNNHTCDNGPQGHRNTDTYTCIIFIPRHAVVKMIRYRTFTEVINTSRVLTISRRDSIITTGYLTGVVYRHQRLTTIISFQPLPKVSFFWIRTAVT
jgi:hypothetical protein